MNARHQQPQLNRCRLRAFAAALLVTASCGPNADHRIELVVPSDAELSGYLDLEASTPNSASTVRFFLDGIQLAELTDLYSLRTETTPVWKTGTDLDWFLPGRHVLRVEAETDSGLLSAEREVRTTGGAAASPAEVPLNGGWKFASLPNDPIQHAVGRQKLTNEPGSGPRTHVDLQPADLMGASPPAAQRGYDDGPWSRIVVPSSLGAVDDQWNSHQGTAGVYRRWVSFDALPEGERGWLVLESCYYFCRAFVNGTEVGRGVGGYLPQRYDISGALVPGDNLIAVMVDNRLSTMGEFADAHRSYWNFGGLFQEVRFERSGPISVTQAKIRSSNLSGLLDVRLESLNGTGREVDVPVGIHLTAPNGQTVYEAEHLVTIPALDDGDYPNARDQAEPTLLMNVASPIPWSPQDPKLYTLKIEPRGLAASRPLTLRFGFRNIAVVAGVVQLNGKPLAGLQGVNDVAGRPGLGRTRPAGLARRIAQEYRRAGFDLVRGAYFPLTPAFLEAADEIGLLVMEELALSGLPASSLGGGPAYSRGVRESYQMIVRDMHHPSVLIWSMGAESETSALESQAYPLMLQGIIAKHDFSGRLITMVTGNPETDTSFAFQDLISLNTSAGWTTPQVTDVLASIQAARTRSGGRPVLVTSYGAEAVWARNSSGRGTEYFQSQLIDEFNRVLRDQPGVLGKVYVAAQEYLGTPDWAGGSPAPVPPFNTRGLVSWQGEQKLGWRVMFSNLRLKGSAIEALPGEARVVEQRVQLQETSGQATSGTLVVRAPPGFEAELVEQPFSLGPNETKEFDIRYRGIIRASVDSLEGQVRAVRDDGVEAHPLLVQLRRADAAAHPASDGFFDLDVNRSRWEVLREDRAAWSLVDAEGYLQLTTRDGTLEGAANDAQNVFLTRAETEGDFSAIASVEGEASLLAYHSEDDFVRLGRDLRGTTPVVRFVHEYRGAIVATHTLPLTSASLLLRLVRRGEEITAEASEDGRYWLALGTAAPPPGTAAGSSSLARALRVGLTAGADWAGGVGRTSRVDRLQVLVSGRVEVNNVARGAALTLAAGVENSVTVSISNWTDRPADLEASLTVPRTWLREKDRRTLAPFSTETFTVRVTPPAAPEAAALTARVSELSGVRVHRTPSAKAVTLPRGANAVLALDSGPSGGVVEEGYRPLSPGDLWDPARGYGWVVPPEGASDPADAQLVGLDAVRRDYVFSHSQRATLRIAVPPGVHPAYLLTGSAASFTENTIVEINGVWVSELTQALPSGQYEWIRFDLDGGPSGGLVDVVIGASRANQRWTMSGLVVLP